MQLDYGPMKPIPKNPGDEYSHADWVFEENQALLDAAGLAGIKNIDEKNFSEIRDELERSGSSIYRTWIQYKEALARWFFVNLAIRKSGSSQDLLKQWDIWNSQCEELKKKLEG